jgi:septal ring factor EnvC (AmiA/AmiB activator)
MWEMIRDTITVLLIPALGWVMLVSRAMEKAQLQIDQHKLDIATLKAEVKETSKQSQQIEITVGKIEAKMEAIDSQLKKIEEILRDLQKSYKAG